MAANQVLGPSGLVTALGGRYNESIMSALLPEYGELALKGYLYSSYSAAVALSIAATATIGNMIWNPPGSGVRVMLLAWASQIIVTDADCTGVGLAVGYQTTTPTTATAATFYGRTLINQVTAIAGKAKAYGIATVLTAPLTCEVLHHNTAAINTVGEDQMAGHFKGSWVLEEGAFATMVALGAAAGAAGHTSSILVAEIPTK